MHSLNIRRHVYSLSIRKVSGTTHFHYENVELAPLKIYLENVRLPSQPASSSSSETNNAGTTCSVGKNDTKISRSCLTSAATNVISFTLSVESNGQKWTLRRTLDDFCQLDRQLHRCVYDRRYSRLAELHANVESENVDAQVNSSYVEHLFKYLGYV